MVSVNKVLLAGRLTRDPELTYIQAGTAICKFGLAVNEKYKSGEEWKEKVHFIDITVWGKSGENVAQYMNKGSRVFIDGKLNYQTWEVQGEKKSKLEVVANNVQFLDAKKENTG